MKHTHNIKPIHAKTYFEAVFFGRSLRCAQVGLSAISFYCSLTYPLEGIIGVFFPQSNPGNFSKRTIKRMPLLSLTQKKQYKTLFSSLWEGGHAVGVPGWDAFGEMPQAERISPASTKQYRDSGIPAKEIEK